MQDFEFFFLAMQGLKSARRNAGSGSESKESEASVEKAEEECPVCHERMGSQFMVLPCGHVLCCKCMFLHTS
jgi:E3 ubiquitin-protein ligase SHPRH